MTDNYSLAADLREVGKMTDSLTSYLRGSNLYGSIGGGIFTGGSSASLTIGSVLMRLRRLNVLQDQLDAGQQSKLRAAAQQHEQVFDENPDAYEKRMLREVESRLDAMQRFFEECKDAPSLCPNIYRPEALRRTIVQEILNHMDTLNIVSAKVDQKRQRTDGKLRLYVHQSDFLWDHTLEPAYPSDVFWWLYHRPLAPES